MNGNDLLEAMSFIDEAYLDEAEKPARIIRFPWKPAAAAAACLAIAWSGFLFQPKSTGHETPAALMANSSPRTLETEEEIAAEDFAAPMLLSAAEQIAVRLDHFEDGYAVFLITQSQIPDYPVGAAVRISMEEAPSDGEYLLSFLPEEAEGNLLCPVELTPVESAPVE